MNISPDFPRLPLEEPESSRQDEQHGPESRCPIEFCPQCEAEDTKLEPKDETW